MRARSEFTLKLATFMTLLESPGFGINTGLVV
jgi:hypothetical protein